jgi:hypothetical protein
MVKYRSSTDQLAWAHVSEAEGLLVLATAVDLAKTDAEWSHSAIDTA